MEGKMVPIERAATVIGCSVDALRDAIGWKGVYDPNGKGDMVYEYELQEPRLGMHRRFLGTGQGPGSVHTNVSTTGDDRR